MSGDTTGGSRSPEADGLEPAPAGDAETELEYIKAMLEWAGEDVRQLHLRVTFALALAVLFITQLPFEKLAALDRLDTQLLFVGISCLLLAAACHFRYLSWVHRSRRKLASHLRTAEAGEAARHWQGVWKGGRVLFLGGDALIVIGVIVLGVVLHDLLTLPK